MSEGINLGDRVKYKVDGFQGIVTGITSYLQSCRQVLITPESLNKDGEKIAGRWVDEPWVVLVKAGVHKPEGTITAKDGKVRSGGPERSHPSR